ncbi:hypothetical protein MHBO_002839 [Bonamia ostreae]|uniref:Peptidase M41 domain-containing protein n=1 Tax=Bonamia ostreae TaxID=126728 RepID=A0ABV2ANP6_9EUKA
MVNLVNIAAIATLKNRENEITQERLRDAVLQVSIGKVNKSIHPSQKVINNTAVHEAGHTVVALFTPGAKKVDLLTILPRGPSLGSTWLTPKEGAQYLQSYEEMLGQLDVMMGGHAAEELVFGRENATSGASSDFKNATNLAVAMVAQFGMSDSLGKFSSDPGQFSQWSPYLKEQVLTEARKLTDDSYCRAFNLLKEKRSVLNKMVNEVSRKDTLLQDEIYEIAQIR